MSLCPIGRIFIGSEAVLQKVVQSVSHREKAALAATALNYQLYFPIRINLWTFSSLSHPFSGFEMFIFPFGRQSFSDVYLLERLCWDCRSGHISFFRCFDRFALKS
jgi:hypothetical protein